ncbi:MAG: DUF3106 domain-containing protein [Betaproteobacteria bacterium]|nr:DUF3106 domain-containing protein [Betaproteobacteria bacterium]
MDFRIAAGLAFVGLLTVGPTAGHAEGTFSAPTWGQLSTQQKEILQPFERDWDSLEPERRERWLVIAQKYPSLSRAQQRRIQNRMQHWASLTPQQRAEAKEIFKQIQHLPKDKRREILQKWLEYEQFPPELKDALRDARTRHP